MREIKAMAISMGVMMMNMKKRFSLSFLLSLTFIFLITQQVHPEIFTGNNSIEPQDPIRGIKPEWKFYSSCVDIITGEKLACPFRISIRGEAEDCPQPGPNIQCGHIDAYHTPASRNDLPESKKVTVLGGLTDPWQQTQATQLPEHVTTPQNPEYSYTYHAGVLSGNVQVKNFSSRPPSGYYFVSPPCESRQTCTAYAIMEVGHEGFFEMPAPLPLPAVPPPWDSGTEPPSEQWDGYVRCGKTADCPEPVVDNPYNWPAHPQVHWGEESLYRRLWRLGQYWYEECGTPLVISDMSLPKGGLLDVNQDWSTPHKTHRRGTDIDISAKSVPINGICGPRPTGGTYDPAWEKTSLRRLAEKECELEPLENDPGHLRPAKKKKK
ncbi:MAG: penicillin-insensitive murein endopeptidase [Nitrospirae bacterium]|nr:penicillin-insensitive murein endopeptidase [Nitrospirota bacterium]